MPDRRTLHALLRASARAYPERIACEDPTGAAIRYADLDAMSDRVRDRLVLFGVAPGDRVGIYLRKSVDAIASIFGILKAGAVYVPVDPLAPAARNAYILNDCSVGASIVEARYEPALRAETSRLGGRTAPILVVDFDRGEIPLRAALEREEAADPAPPASSRDRDPGDLGYILYTSGSTGKPKGVMLSHENALAYIDWCTEVFAPRTEDVLSSHAPLHFDLSVLDVFLSIRHGARLVLIGEEVGKDPARLAPLISEKRISVWYSAPSILTLLAQYGDLDHLDFRALRLVLFAGEVFPVKHLRALKALWPQPRYFNLYGPTETNVCTYFEVPPEIPQERTEPYPIGKSCSHYRIRLLDESGREVPRGVEGEVCAAGPSVMLGYWNLAEVNASAFHVGPGGERWYRTGDIAAEEADGNLRFLGRRDRMVKRRGYRVELGEIEAALYRFPDVEEAAALALPDEEAGVRIKAFLTFRSERRPSLIALKRFCAENLPLYMVPDLFAFPGALPKTSTGKVDYQTLESQS